MRAEARHSLAVEYDPTAPSEQRYRWRVSGPRDGGHWWQYVRGDAGTVAGAMAAADQALADRLEELERAGWE